MDIFATFDADKRCFHIKMILSSRENDVKIDSCKNYTNPLIRF